MQHSLGRTSCLVLAMAAIGHSARPQWRQLETKGDVVPAHGSAIAFHPPSRRIILFGGVSPAQVEAKYRLVVAEWSADPEAPLFWQRLDAGGTLPGGRIRPAFAYDPVADRLVVFGGAEDRPFTRLRNDVYVLDNASGISGEPVWSKLEPEGPAPEPRANAQGVLLHGGSEFLIFGGCTRGPYGCDLHQNDVWVLSGLNRRDAVPSWRRLPTEGEPPGGRSSHTLTLCPTPDKALMFGGADTRPRNDAWNLHIEADMAFGRWQYLPVNGKAPAGRNAHAAGCLSSQNALIIMGGTRISTVTSDVWILSPLEASASPQWKEIVVPGPRPMAREQPHLIIDSQAGLIFLTGGVGQDQYFSDSWVLDLGQDWNPRGPE